MVSVCSLPVYRNVIDFCVLTLYPAILTVSSRRFFVAAPLNSSWFSRGRFISSFPIFMPFISFSYFIALARTSNTMSRRSDESSRPGFEPDLRRKTVRL